MCKRLHLARFTCVNLKTHHTASVDVGPENFQCSCPTHVTPTFLLFNKMKRNDLSATEGDI